ncbi:MAG: thiol:disulfide interchange protein DsbA/DsbL [Burkholderiales bacterium]|nr:thiol:disulfide interchange protein DsbA/DsbL [Burkholderiales bacterium]MDP2399996.1 thiol:disulfide interchange protein DsbA/DsbL [Burkholderiales bacterium]
MPFTLFSWRTFIAAALSLFFASAHAQLTAGKDYALVQPPQPTDSGSKIEVIEFFWYGCPHCNNLQPSLETWLKRKPADVEFRRVPAVFQESWLPMTRAYYTFEALGMIDKLHHEMFVTLHKQRVQLRDANAIFDWAASKGVDRKKFADTYNSFGVNGKAQRSIELTRKYDIPGTPAVVVDGRYLTAPSMSLKADRSVDYDRFFQVVDGLIAEARKSKGGK